MCALGGHCGASTKHWRVCRGTRAEQQRPGRGSVTEPCRAGARPVLGAVLLGTAPALPFQQRSGASICSWRLFRSPGLEFNCFYLPAAARAVAMESVPDGAGRAGLGVLCCASSLLVPIPQDTSPFIRNDLICSTAVFELCATSDLILTQLCLCSSAVAGAVHLTRDGKGDLESAPHPQLLVLLCLGPGSLSGKLKVASLIKHKQLI